MHMLTSAYCLMNAQHACLLLMHPCHTPIKQNDSCRSIPLSATSGIIKACVPAMQRAILILLLATISTSALGSPRKLLEANFALSNTLDFATEHQRILAELEEVHQLRERMLQEGKELFVQLHTYHRRAHLIYVMHGD